jgi:putative transport protein
MGDPGMEWIGATFTRYPELAVFLVVGIGYWVGAFKLLGVGLGPVTGSLMVGLLVGALFPVTVSSTAKSILFLLFLFSIGYSVGPKFFQAMRGGGLRYVALAAVIAVTGLATAYGVARAFDLDPGFTAGMLSGALTESPAIGTATEAINSLPLSEAERTRLVSHVAVADAICYVFGALGVILFCGTIGPRLLRIDLVAEAGKLEKELGIERSTAGVVSAWRPVELRAYRLADDARVVGRSVGEIERMVAGARIFVERIRRDGAFVAFAADTPLQAGDVVALTARREVLTEVVGRARVTEIDDREALDVPTASFDVFVTNKAIAGRTLSQIAASDLPLRSVFLGGISRGRLDIPIAPGTVIERGDIVRLTGPHNAVARVAGEIGDIVNQPSQATDFVALGLGIFTGALIGLAIVVPLGAMRIPLGTSVGTLLAGLMVGWLHSVRPGFGRIPEGAVSLMTSLGLAAFIAMIGLGAGPHFIDALREAGVVLFFGGVLVTSLPLLAGLWFGHAVLKLQPILLLGAIAGALTMAAGFAAVQDKSGSSVAVLGYSATVAIGHILLTTWGTVIVRLVT